MDLKLDFTIFKFSQSNILFSNPIMVYYFTAEYLDEPVMIYVGKDKHEVDTFPSLTINNRMKS
jgi:hypothetical protein